MPCRQSHTGPFGPFGATWSDSRQAAPINAPHHHPDISSENIIKIISFFALLEYVFIKPRIILVGDDTDFIGFALLHALLAYFVKINITDLSTKQRKTALLDGLLGGVIGYAWMFLCVALKDRSVYHLLAAHLLIVAGILFGAWAERRKRSGGLRSGAGQRL